MQFGVLGTLDVSENGRPIAVRGVMQRRLLGLLLSNANRVVSTDALVEALWNGAPPRSASKTLQSHIVRLRDVVDPDRRLLQTRPPGYFLQADARTLDALRFELIVARGRRARAAGAYESASAMIADALGLWRGPAYADLRDCQSLSVEADRLEDLRLAALEDRIDADLVVGGGTDLIAELEACVSANPYRERLWRHLAVSLCRAGRQADAIAAVARVKALLRDELGVELGPELAATEQAILTQDPRLLPVDHPSRRIAPLPAVLTADSWPLVGRHAELTWLHHAWAEAARSRGGLVLLRGPGGIGRSRLLAEFARDLSARAVVVRFGSGRPGRDALVDALHQGGVPLAPGASQAEVLEALRRSAELVPTLIVLDDLHLASDVPASLVAARSLACDLPLLILISYNSDAASPALQALGDRLDPRGERTWELGQLPAEAVNEIIDRTVQPADRRSVVKAAAAACGHPRELRRAVTEAVENAAVQRLNGAARDAGHARRVLDPARAALATGVLDVRAARQQRAGADGSLPESATCPFKGLASYDVADAEFFVGRERLTAQLVARLVEDDLLVIVGGSGSGKSSVARAGLLSALAEGVLPGSARWQQLILVPGADPPAALARALHDHGGDGTQIVVLVDQFEEIFTSCSDEERRRAFVAELLSLADRGVRVVLTLRADYYGACAAYPALAARLADNSVLIGPLTDAELGRVVEIPAQRAGLTIGAGLTDVVVAEVSGQVGALPLLSTALLRAWEHRDSRILTVSSYRDGGGIARAVERLGESAYGRMDPAAAAAARRLLLRLADPGPSDDALVRRRAPRTEVVAEGDDAANRALAILTERRLVTITDDTVEVAHEALFAAWPRLRAWLDEDAVGRRLLRHLSAAANDWMAAGRDPAELYRGARLQAGLDWAAVHREDLTELEGQFLDAGAAEAERQRRDAEQQLAGERRGRRRLLRVLTALAVVLVLAVAAAVIAANARRDAQQAAEAAADAARVADARRLGALGVITEDLDRALLLAVEAVRMDDSADTRGDLLATLWRSPAAQAVVRLSGGDQPFALDMSPDGRSLVVGDNHGNLFLVDTVTRRIEVLDRPAGNDETIHVAEFSADGQAVATMHTWGNTSAVEVWDLKSRTVKRLPGTTGTWGLGWSPTGRRLAVVMYEADAIVVDLDHPAARAVRLLGSAGQEIGPVRWTGPLSVVISPAGKAVGVWDAATGRRQRSIDLAEESVTVGVSPDGRTMAVGRASEVQLYDVRTSRRRAVLTGHRAQITDLVFSPDGRLLASTGKDREVIVWDVGAAALRERLSGHAGQVTRAVWSPDGRGLWTASLDGSLMSWDVSGQHRLARPITPKASSDAGWFSLDGQGGRIVGGFDDGTARVWDIAAGRPLTTVRIDNEPVPVVGLSPDGSLFATGGFDGRALIYRVADGTLLGPIAGLSGKGVLDATFSPDGKTVAISTFDGALHLVDVASRRPNGPPLKPSGAVWSTVWSADGRTVLLTSQFTNEVTVWSVPERRRLATVTPSTAPTLTAAYSPDEKLVVTGGLDGWIRFWDPVTWKQLGNPVLMGAGMVLTASFSPDGSHLVTGAFDGTVRLLDVATRKPLGPPMLGADNKRAFARWIPGGRVVAGFGDGSITSYDVDPTSWRRRACAIAGRQLTRDEWADVLPERPYEFTC